MGPKSRKEDEKSKKFRCTFKPDIRIANAIVGAISFLQKAGLQADPKMIRKCIQERSRKGSVKGLGQLQLYLNRGLELGILRKWHGCFKLGDFKLKKKNVKKKKSSQKMEKEQKETDAPKSPTENSSTTAAPVVEENQGPALCAC